ncbi:MAG: secretin and TonB N-terminal domain-containing protein, partial [Candidatus Saelkia tenebricola]|nr:secretin and TonB N-terminal domain-containing protein [Candidatus Saelkia tenebricola]
MKIASIIIVFLISVSFIPVDIVWAEEAVETDVVTDEEIVAEKLGKNIKIEQKGENIFNIEFRNADLKDIIRFFAYQYGLNIIADKEVEGMVTASLGNISIKEALKQILDSQNYTMKEIDNVIRVRAKPALVKSFQVENIAASGILENITSLLGDEGKIVVDEVSNSIMITDTEDNLSMIQGFIKNADVKGKQVLIEAKFIETSLGTTKNLGIDWTMAVTASGAGRPVTWPFSSAANNRKYLTNSDSTENVAGFPDSETDAYTFGTLDFSEFQAVLRALLTNTNSKVISNPQVTTLNNQEAEMGVATEYPLPTYEINSDTGELTVSGYEYKDIGITLKVTPFIARDNYITMSIEPTVGAVDATVTITGTGFELPIIESKTATTKVTVKDGETIVIGGLISDTKTKTTRKIPFLGNIPLLGKIFSYNTDSDTSSELLIFVTPHIINLEGQKELDEKKIKELYEDIEDLLYKKEYEEVILKVDEILEIDSEENDAKKIKEEAIEKLEVKKNKEELEVELKTVKLEILWKEANKAYAAQDYETARSKYTNILALKPSDEMAVNMLQRCQNKIDSGKSMDVSSVLLSGRRAMREGKHTEALELFKKALEFDPENKEAQSYIKEIDVSIQTKETEASLDVDLIHDQQLQAMWKEANKVYIQGDYETARAKYTEIITLQPDNKSAMEMLDRCEDKIGDDKAKKISSLLLLGEKSFRKKEYDKALGYFDDVLELDSMNKDAEDNIVEINKQLELKQTKEQIKADLNRAIELYKDEKYIESRVMLKNIVKNDPANVVAEKYIVLCSQAMRKKEDLNTLWEEANRLYARRSYELARTKYADILALDSDNKSAMDMLARCEDKIDIVKEEEVSSLLVLGKKALRRGEYLRALKYFDKVLELDPANKGADNNIIEINKKMELDETEIQVRTGLNNAIALYQDKKHIEAKAVLEEVLKKDPDNIEAKKYLSLCSDMISKRQKVEDLWEQANQLYAKGDYESAREKFGDILSIDVMNQDVMNKFNKCEDKINETRNQKVTSLLISGKKAYRNEEYQKALEYFDEVLDLAPDNKEADRKILEVKESMAKEKKEEKTEKQQFKKIADLPQKQDEELKVLWEKANQLYTQRNYESARAKYAQILSIQPDNKSAMDMLARCEDKIDILRKREVSTLLVSARKEYRNKEYQKALEYFDNVLRLDPANKEADNSIVKINREIKVKELEDKEDVEEMSIEYDLEREKELKLLWEEANALYAAKQYESAWAKYADIVSVDSNDQIAVNMLNRCEDNIYNSKLKEISSFLLAGERAYRKKEYLEALDYFNKVLELDSLNREAKNSIVEIYEQIDLEKKEKQIQDNLNKAIGLYQNGKYKESKNMLQKILLEDSRNIEASRHFALCSDMIDQEQKLRVLWKQANEYYAEKDYQQAWSSFDDILVINPDDKIAQEMLTRCEGKIYQDRSIEISALISIGKKNLKNQNYQKALESFNQVLDIELANKEARGYILEINQRLETESRKEAIALKEREEKIAEGKI